MWNTFKYTALYLMRDRDLLVWSLAFPIILSTLFSFMFAGLDDTVYATELGLVVVQDEVWESDEAVVLREVVDAVSEPGTAADEVGSLVVPQYVESEEAAQRALAETDAIAYLTVGAQGSPHLHMKLDPADNALTAQQTVVKTVLDGAQRTKGAVTDAVESRVRSDVEQAVTSGAFSPAAFDPSTLPASVKDYEQGTSISSDDVEDASALLLSMGIDVEALVDQALEVADSTFTERVSVTHNAPTESTRYYYALLGMATMFAATIGLVAMSRACPNTSEVGARRVLGAVPRAQVLAATFAVSWVLAFVCLLVAFAYIRLVLGVDFGGQDAACVGAIAASAFTACALGVFVGALPGIPEMAKNGVMTCVTCLSALFAGLYGQACMSLADEIAAAAPWTAYVNPARLISQAFYALYYYDSYQPFLMSVGALVAMAAVLLVAAALISRRQQHEHL
ncbi:MULTISPECIES: ABC transporter permease [unclassified Adlercreutzia]|uniref:ABC transporter permease n=1 Tax=unclassified Adlercreutzia TaxID=2636013 RepID=UPI0013EA52E1|nr:MULTISPECIES: ABC transporter permease [unclassified Adlercreutzia]